MDPLSLFSAVLAVVLALGVGAIVLVIIWIVLAAVARHVNL